MEKIAFGILVSFVTAKVDCQLHRDDITELERLTTQVKTGPDATTVRAMLKAMGNQRKIEAIKYFREITGDGLKESKDAIEYALTGLEPF